ncbi:GNAT family N-acetyltransferase [Streptomyces sp. NPDC002073]|uniref:GNAT family N-acetyltransferase n=1 Tax=Streptomyces sp. NBC_00239 TaxID=2903640 RepID=UPI002E2E30C1|nr:GNAT family N-acetyltransferase [Streptomyces sp. NBC_00239]
MRVVRWVEGGVPAGLRRQVLELQDDAWPPPGGIASDGPSHDPLLHPVSLLLVDDTGTVLAALDLLHKELRHAGHGYRVAGLSTVVTRAAVRGRGHGRRLVTEARAVLAADPAVDLALFTCDRPLVPFYAAAGWAEVPGAVLVGGTAEDPFPSDAPGFDKAVMGGFFSERARAHRADFPDSRIALHPGTVDRLW